MARCPGCEAPLGMWRTYRMVTYFVPTIRCRACGLVLRLSTGAAVLRILLCAGGFAFVCYAAFAEEFFGLTRWHAYYRYLMIGLVVVGGVLGSFLISLTAVLAGPVPEPRCPDCGSDLTEMRPTRCPAF